LLNDDILNAKNYINGTYENALRFFEKGKSDAALSVIKTCSGKFGKYETASEIKDLEGQLYYKFRIQEDGISSSKSYKGVNICRNGMR